MTSSGCLQPYVIACGSMLLALTCVFVTNQAPFECGLPQVAFRNVKIDPKVDSSDCSILGTSSHASVKGWTGFTDAVLYLTIKPTTFKEGKVFPRTFNYTSHPNDSLLQNQPITPVRILIVNADDGRTTVDVQKNCNAELNLPRNIVAIDDWIEKVSMNGTLPRNEHIDTFPQFMNNLRAYNASEGVYPLRISLENAHKVFGCASVRFQLVVLNQHDSLHLPSIISKLKKHMERKSFIVGSFPEDELSKKELTKRLQKIASSMKTRVQVSRMQWMLQMNNKQVKE